MTCELKKKNHDKKNKICKEFDDLTFHWSHIQFHYIFSALRQTCCRESETSRMPYCSIHKAPAAKEIFSNDFKRLLSWNVALSTHLTTLLKPPALPWFSDTKKLGLVLHCPLLKSIPLKQLKFPWTKHTSRSFFCGASWRKTV